MPIAIISTRETQEIKEYKDYHYVRKPFRCKVCLYGGMMTQEQFDGYIESCTRCNK